jgi:hypothetical protein
MTDITRNGIEFDEGGYLKHMPAELNLEAEKGETCFARRGNYMVPRQASQVTECGM